MKKMVSCNAASKATMLSMGSLELLLGRVSLQFLILMRWVVRRCQGRFSGRVCLGR